VFDSKICPASGAAVATFATAWSGISVAAPGATFSASGATPSGSAVAATSL
jgi:hypothetical protein